MFMPIRPKKHKSVPKTLDYDLPDGVTYSVNPDIEARYILKKFGCIRDEGGFGGYGITLFIPIRISRNWYGKRRVELIEPYTFNSSHPRITVYGQAFIQDAVDLAEQLSKVYNQDIDVHLSKESIDSKIKFLCGESFEDAEAWLETVQS